MVDKYIALCDADQNVLSIKDVTSKASLIYDSNPVTVEEVIPLLENSTFDFSKIAFGFPGVYVASIRYEITLGFDQLSDDAGIYVKALRDTIIPESIQAAQNNADGEVTRDANKAFCSRKIS